MSKSRLSLVVDLYRLEENVGEIYTREIFRSIFRHTNYTIILHIRNFLQHISLTQRNQISFLWIHRHRGILGNELSDVLAKDTAISPTFYIPMSYVMFEWKLNISWQKLYKQSTNHNIL